MADTPYKHAQWRDLRPRIYARDDGRCQIRDLCDGTDLLDDYDVDHIVPWLEGGAWFDEGNLRLACPPCNRGRSSKRQALAARINRTPAATPSRDW